MSGILVEDRVSHSVAGWHDEFLKNVLPAVEAVARIRFRCLPACEFEESMAESVATAVIFFVRLIKQGKNPTAFAGRLGQVAVLRVLAGRLTSTSDNSKDVLSRYARLRRGFAIHSLDAPQHSARGEWQEIVVEDGKTTPAEIAASRIDFGAWLAGMTSRRRAIAELLAAGYRTEEVAQKFSLSPARISQLRREFEASWLEFQREAGEREMAVS
jgi:hypothetical protein